LAGLRLKLNARDARLLLSRLELNPRIAENPYWFLPVADDGHGEYVQAGRAGVSSEWCGRFKGRLVCRDKEYHKGVVYRDVDFTGMNAVMNSHFWCHRAVCVKCFIGGFAVREARVIESRIAEAVERGFGVAEHIVLSPPKSLRELSFGELFKLGVVVLRDRGVTAGGLIPHGRRIDRKLRKLVWSPHIHGIGFIAGGFGRCRECVHSRGDCKSCDGFKGRQVRGYAKDGWIVKVEPPRKTVFGSVYYVLNHVSVKVGLGRFHTVRWFGLLGNSVFKGIKGSRDATCPVCRVAGHCSKMEHDAYWGKKPLSDSGCNAVPDFDVDGSPNFPDVERR
jgi:hypothetical protein